MTLYKKPLGARAQGSLCGPCDWGHHDRWVNQDHLGHHGWFDHLDRPRLLVGIGDQALTPIFRQSQSPAQPPVRLRSSRRYFDGRHVGFFSEISGPFRVTVVSFHLYAHLMYFTIFPPLYTRWQLGIGLLCIINMSCRPMAETPAQSHASDNAVQTSCNLAHLPFPTIPPHLRLITMHANLPYCFYLSSIPKAAVHTACSQLHGCQLRATSFRLYKWASYCIARRS